MPDLPPAVPRVPAIDRLRATALVLMLVHHFVKWLAGDAREVLPGWDGFALTDVAAPAFAVAAGASAVLFAEGRVRRGESVVPTIVRRYGLLIPAGMLLQQLTAGTPWDWGVLHTLGASVTLSTVAALGVRSVSGTAVLATTALVAGPLLEQRTAVDVLAGDFPVVTYLGFALVGALIARVLLVCEDCGRYALAAGGALGVVALAMAAMGSPPDRYPGDATFVVPGLALTFLLYGVLDRWRPRPDVLDGLLRRVAAHTLGIFFAHYIVFWAVNRYGWRETFSPNTALAVAFVSTIALAVIAPRVPTLPWSPRTGWKRGAQKRWASSAAYRATTASVSAVR